MPIITRNPEDDEKVNVIDDNGRVMATGYLSVEFLPPEGGNRKCDVQFVEQPEDRL